MQELEEGIIQSFSNVENDEYTRYCFKINKLIATADSASEYFMSLQQNLEETQRYELKFKIELYYLQINASAFYTDSIGNFIHSFLQDFLKQRKALLEANEIYRESFYGYFFDAIFKIANALISSHSLPAAKRVLTIGINFFTNCRKIDNAVTLILAKGDLYLEANNTKYALSAYRYAFKILYFFYQIDDYSSLDDIQHIIEALEKITQMDKKEKLYAEILEMLKAKTDSSSSSFEEIAIKALHEKNYLVCETLFHIGYILLKLSLADINLIRNPLLKRSLKNASFSKLLDDLSSNTSLFSAIESGDNDRAKALIRDAISIKDIYEDMTPLHLAVKLGNFEIAKAIIETGMKVNYYLINNEKIVEPPLFAAIATGNLEIVKLLINEARANPNFFYVLAESQRRSRSALYLAFTKGHSGIITFLLQNKAELFEGEDQLLITNQLYQELICKRGMDVINDIFFPLYDHPNNQKTPIFCLHPVSGECNIYRKLATLVKTFSPNSRDEELKSLNEFSPKQDLRRSVIGIMSPGFKYGKHLESIEEMADFSLNAINRKYRSDHNIILGFSLGGLVAYEMCKKLKREGHKNLLCVLIDTPSPSAIARLSKNQYAKNLLFSLGPCLKAFNVSTNCLPKISELESLSSEKQIELCMTKMIQGIKNIHQGNPAKVSSFETMANCIHKNLLAALHYNPQNDAFSPMIYSYNTKQSIEIYGSPDLGWENHTTGFYQTYDCDHFEIMDTPAIVKITNSILNSYQTVYADIVRGLELTNAYTRQVQKKLSQMGIDCSQDKNLTSNSKLSDDNNAQELNQDNNNERLTETAQKYNIPTSPSLTPFFANKTNRVQLRAKHNQEDHNSLEFISLS